MAHLQTSDGLFRADHYVLAAGPAAVDLGRTAGLRLPIYPIKGYSITLPAQAAAPRTSITHVGHKVVFCKLGGRMRVAGFAEFARENRAVVYDRIRALATLSERLFPGACDYGAALNGWAGERPMTPDGLPIVGPIEARQPVAQCRPRHVRLDALLRRQRAAGGGAGRPRLREGRDCRRRQGCDACLAASVLSDIGMTVRESSVETARSGWSFNAQDKDRARTARFFASGRSQL